MKNIALICLLLALVTGCRTQTPDVGISGERKNPLSEMCATNQPSVYTNKYLGLAIRIPEGWAVLESAKVEESFKLMYGYRSSQLPLLTCYRKDQAMSGVIQCLVQANSTPAEALRTDLFGKSMCGTSPIAETDVHTLTINGRAFSHVQVTPTSSGIAYVVDAFLTDINGDTVVIFLTQDKTRQLLVPKEFIEENFRVRSDSTRVIIANGDLPTGTVLTTNNLAVKTLPNADLKGDGISLDQFDVLLGHRLVVPRKQFEPIRWHDTDIVITNRDSREQSPINSTPSADAGQGSQGK